MKGAILVGGERTNPNPLSLLYPTALLPLLNKPLIEHTIELYKRHGIKDIAILAAKTPSPFIESLGKGERFGLNIEYFLCQYPRGAAGCLKNLQYFVTDEPLIVINGSTFIDVDLGGVIDAHIKRGSFITIGVARRNEDSLLLENVITGPTNEVLAVSSIHQSSNRRELRVPIGIYILDPHILDFVPEKGYFDIKEQLISVVRKANLPVHSFDINDYSMGVLTPTDYYHLNMNILKKDIKKKNETLSSERERDIWIGKETHISKGARLLGPIIIGNNCELYDRSLVIGPTIIGDNCVIKEDTYIRESILLSGSVFSKGVVVEYSIISSGIEVPEESKINETVLTKNSFSSGILNLFENPLDIRLITKIGDLKPYEWLRYNIYNISKRIFDILLSLIGIILTFPLMILIAVLIKIDSTGNVIFRQIRCGKNGKTFKMLKFRTMYKDSEHLQATIKNQVDGPMFKASGDPRVTKVGGFLRKTSLDELPQFFHVLIGDMS
ncbi:MAG: sugar transferase, partial [Nitrospinae bacterium]|nr:sugar transferase [Nitrospinota bacterium]